MISSIIQIPKDLLQNRVLAFLDVQDLVGFDSALLNHRLRPQQLQQLNGAHLNTDSIKIDESGAKWFLKRSIHVSSLRVSSAAKDFSTIKQLARSVSTLVSFDNCDMLSAEAINDFLEFCQYVKHLSFRMGFNSRMEGNILESIAAYCQDLQKLNLSYSRCFLPDQLIPLLSSCRSLTDLDLSHCASWVNNECISILATNCPQLQSLQAISCINCGDKAIGMLAQHCRDLNHLNLRGWHMLTDDGLSVLTACVQLRAVDISGSTRITSEGIIILAQGCTQLENVGIPRCDSRVSLAIEALVQHCPALQLVRCCSRYITDRSLESLQNCSLLHTLEITEVGNVTYDALLQLLDHCTAMQRLELPSVLLNYAGAANAAVNSQATKSIHTSLAYIDFTSFSSLTDAAFIALICKCPNVTELDIRMCIMLTDASIVAVAVNCRKLEVLNISNIANVTDAAVCAIAKSCYFLWSLNVGGCNRLTDIAASAIGNNCPNLRNLNVFFCTKLTDAGVVEIVQKCRLLRNLELGGCGNITRHTVDAIVQYGARLRCLYLSMCVQINAEIVKALRSAKPNCEVIW